MNEDGGVSVPSLSFIRTLRFRPATIISSFPKQPNQNRSTFKLQNSLTNGTVEGSPSKYTLDHETKIHKKSLPTVSGNHVGSLVALPDF